VTPFETAETVALLVIPIVAILIFGYLAVQGSRRAGLILRWGAVPVYVGMCITAIRLVGSNTSDVWATYGLAILIASFAAGRLSRSFSVQLGPRRSLVILRNAYAGQTAGAWLCAVQAAIYGAALGIFLAIVAMVVGSLWLWITMQLTKAIAAQTASHRSPV
jgi:hypothetical protein